MSSELSPSNYRRIALINWLLAIPLLIIFAWPYHFIAKLNLLGPVVGYAGSLLFALPFMITILHGHVTMALGSLHRHHFYDWLHDHPLTYGLFFHEVFVSTRFRLMLLILSILVLIAAVIFPG